MRMMRVNVKKRKDRLCRLLLLFLGIVVGVLGNCPVSYAANAPYSTMTQDYRGRLVSSQDGYLPQYSITKVGEYEFKNAADLFIDKNDMMYIADTGNGRILLCTKSGELRSVIGKGILKAPSGIFVDGEGNIYAADPRLQKVMVFSPGGEVIREYIKPEGPLYGKNNKFVPLKVVVDGAGNLYVISEGNTNGIAQIDKSGEFLGYFGANYTMLTFQELIRRLTFTDTQKSQLKRNVPSSPNNLSIDGRGFVYTVTQGAGSTGLKKFNMAGVNMLKGGIVDENVADVAVGSINNIITVSKDGYIYEYSREGDLLFLFGGRDDGKNRGGLFVSAMAIVLDSSGHLYILDSENNKIQVFETTEYADTVHKALALYQEGAYIESKTPWEEVLRQNSLFDYGHKGMGEAYYKLEKYSQALAAFKRGGDKDGYSQSFWEVRNVWLKENLLTLFFICIGIAIIVKSLRKLHRKYGILQPAEYLIESFHDIKIVRELRFAGYMPKNPADAYYGIKKESKVSIFSSTLMYFAFLVVYVINKYYSGFLFKTVPDGRYDLVSDIFYVLGAFGLVVICNNLICSIRDGEGKLRDVYCSLAYAVMPYIFLKPVVIILSHVLTYNEGFLIRLLNFIIYASIAVLVIVMIKEIQNYTLRETFKNIALTLFTMLIFIITAVIFTALINQVVDFVKSIVKEVHYRVS